MEFTDPKVAAQLLEDLEEKEEQLALAAQFSAGLLQRTEELAVEKDEAVAEKDAAVAAEEEAVWRATELRDMLNLLSEEGKLQTAKLAEIESEKEADVDAAKRKLEEEFEERMEEIRGNYERMREEGLAEVEVEEQAPSDIKKLHQQIEELRVEGSQREKMKESFATELRKARIERDDCKETLSGFREKCEEEKIQQREREKAIFTEQYATMVNSKDQELETLRANLAAAAAGSNDFGGESLESQIAESEIQTKMEQLTRERRDAEKKIIDAEREKIDAERERRDAERYRRDAERERRDALKKLQNMSSDSYNVDILSKTINPLGTPDKYKGTIQAITYPNGSKSAKIIETRKNGKAYKKEHVWSADNFTVVPEGDKQIEVHIERSSHGHHHDLLIKFNSREDRDNFVEYWNRTGGPEAGEDDGRGRADAPDAMTELEAFRGADQVDRSAHAKVPETDYV